jgi:hypothetical protein
MVIEIVTLFDEKLNLMIDISSKNLIKNLDRYRIKTLKLIG